MSKEPTSPATEEGDRKKALEDLLKAVRSGVEAGELRTMLHKLSSGEKLSATPHPAAVAKGHGRELLEALEGSDPSAQFEALSEICEVLAMATEDTIAQISRANSLPPLEELIPRLVTLISEGMTPDIILLSCRSLSHLSEALPQSLSSISSAGAPLALCSKLLSVEYVDIAEQCLSLLEKIALEHPGNCISSGSISASLEYCDFYTASSQRKAASIVSNCCRSLSNSPDSFDTYVFGSLSKISALLNHSDKKIVYYGLQSFLHIAESLSNDEEKLARAFTPELLQTLLSLTIATKQSADENQAASAMNTPKKSTTQTTQTSSEPFSPVIWRIFSIICSNPSSNLIKQLLDFGVADIIGSSLSFIRPSNKQQQSSPISSTTTTTTTTTTATAMAMTRTTSSPAISTPASTRHNVDDILSFVSELLPPIMTSSTIATTTVTPNRRRKNSGKSKSKSRSTSSEDQLSTPQQVPIAVIYNDKPDLLLGLIKNVLPPIIRLFGSSSIGHNAKILCVMITAKIIQHCPITELVEFMKQVNIASWISSVLSSSSEDTTMLLSGMHIIQSLSTKLSNTSFQLSSELRREGVAFELEKIISSSIVGNGSGSNSGSGSGGLNEQIIEEVKSTLSLLSTNEPHKDARMEKLRKLAEDLRSLSSKQSDIETVNTLITAIRNELVNSPSAASAFEIAESGIVNGLLSFLNPFYSDLESAKNRTKSFTKAFMDESNKEFIQNLIFKLQEALTKSEHLSLLGDSSPANSSSSSSLSGLRFVTQPFKIRLHREGSAASQQFKDIPEQIVMVDPLALISSIEDYLLEKVSIASSSSLNAPSTSSSTHKEVKGEEEEEEEEAVDHEDENEEEHTSEIGETSEEEPTGEIHRKRTTEQDGGSNDESRLEPIRDIVDTPKQSPSIQTRKDQQQEQAAAAAAAATAIKESKLTLLLDGKQAPKNASLFEILQQSLRPDTMPVQRLWETAHTITYRRSTAEDIAISEKLQTEKISSEKFIAPKVVSVDSDPLIDSLKTIYSETPLPLPQGEIFTEIIQLLRILNLIYNHFSTTTQQTSLMFINERITDKLTRQLLDGLSSCTGVIPHWTRALPLKLPFLFPVEIRQLFLACTDCGITRAIDAILERISLIHKQLKLNGGDDSDSGNGGDDSSLSSAERRGRRRFGRIPKLRVRISRDRLLECAIKLMAIGSYKSLLEIEYHGEAGTGLGPTQEFFTLASRELQKAELDLWLRDSVTENGFIVPPRGGLFPKPMKPEELSPKMITLWEFAGTLCAKAIIDRRLLDLPLSLPFLKWMTGQTLTIEDLKECNPAVGKSLKKLMNLAESNKHAPSSTTIEDLCLDFTLIGNPKWDLCFGGSKKYVTEQNVSEYIDLTTRTFLSLGVSSQLEHFGIGFSKVFPITHLSLFTTDELSAILSGANDSEPWTKELLLESTKFEYGYSRESRVIQDLMDVMTTFGLEDRKQFLLFLTGSPRLPIGGFRSLNPQFTVVRKAHQFGTSPDSLLPSVNACFYYLKLPEYSSKSILQDRLLFTIYNGQGSFDLT